MLSVLITEELIQEIVGGGPAFSSAHIWPQQSLAQPAERPWRYQLKPSLRHKTDPKLRVPFHGRELAVL